MTWFNSVAFWALALTSSLLKMEKSTIKLRSISLPTFDTAACSSRWSDVSRVNFCLTFAIAFFRESYWAGDSSSPSDAENKSIGLLLLILLQTITFCSLLWRYSISNKSRTGGMKVAWLTVLEIAFEPLDVGHKVTQALIEVCPDVAKFVDDPVHVSFHS